MKMKTVSSLFLVLSLSTGCGVLKHTKNSVNNAESTLSESDQASTPIVLQNVLPAPSPWKLGSDQEFMVIAKFASSDLPAQFSNRGEAITSIGTLNAHWNYTRYLEETTDEKPTPIKNDATIAYPNIELLITKLDNDPTHIGLAVRSNNYQSIENKTEAVSVDYDYKEYCDRIYGQITFSMPFHDQTLVLHGVCTPLQSCTLVDSGDENNGKQVTYPWFIGATKNRHCEHGNYGLTQRNYFNNTSVVDEFIINFNEAFQNLNMQANFKAAGQN